MNSVPVHSEAKTPISFLDREESWSKSYILSVGVLLFVTGIAKIVSALGKTKVLVMPDPIFNIPYNDFLISIGLIELIIATFCLTSANRKSALVLVAVLSLNILAYRTGLWFIHWRGYCPCMGTIFQTIHLSRYQADFLMRSVVLYLTVGSLYFLVSSWWGCKACGFACKLNKSNPLTISSASICGD